MLMYCIQAQCVWSCSCIVFNLIVYGRVHVLYLSSLCSYVVFGLIVYGRVYVLYIFRLIVYGHVHLLYSGLLCVCSCSLLKYIKRDDGSVRRSPSPVVPY